jgi:hypothetical protein
MGYTIHTVLLRNRLIRWDALYCNITELANIIKLIIVFNYQLLKVLFRNLSLEGVSHLQYMQYMDDTILLIQNDGPIITN